MSDVVTGDAVVLELRLARVPTRALALAIDLAIMVTALGVLLAIATGALESVDDALGAAVGLTVTLVIFVGYPVTLETLTRGRSVGKIALGLRVVREDGGPIGFRQALTRGLAGFIVDFGVLSLFTGVIGLVSSLSSEKGKRIGDVLAGTVVLRERVPGQQADPAPMPPPLADWADGLELSGLSDDLALAARQFLLRCDQLDPEVRASMAASLASEVAARVSPAPPPGTPAEPYLAAVTAQRRIREQARLSGRPPGQPSPG
ncbi:MAG: RDD family protein [Pseudonocardiaceae bacterium]|nr:RDD family protein [Pseudonocardiaceae bacterium]